jgi:hypothetical protein
MNKILQYSAVIMSILALVIAGAALGLNRTPGPVGLKGDKGLVGPAGQNGIQGQPGINGTDAPINKPPIIRVLTQTGDFVRIFPTILNNCKYTFGVTVSVMDSDDSNMMIMFYHKLTKNGPYIQGDIFFGGNGEYSSTVIYPYENIIPGTLTNYWLIIAWDGADISSAECKYTLNP